MVKGVLHSDRMCPIAFDANFGHLENIILSQLDFEPSGAHTRRPEALLFLVQIGIVVSSMAGVEACSSSQVNDGSL